MMTVEDKPDVTYGDVGGSKEQIEKLERRLARFREQLNLHVTVDLRSAPSSQKIGRTNNHLLDRDRVYQFKLEQSNSFKDLDLAIKNIMNAIIERDVFQINMMKVLQSEVANTRHELLQEIRVRTLSGLSTTLIISNDTSRIPDLPNRNTSRPVC